MSTVFDQNGLATAYVLLPFVLVATVYATIRVFKKRRTISCKCTKRRKKETLIYFLPLLYATLAVIMWAVKSIKVVPTGYSPYRVLGVEEGATIKEVKMAFKKVLKEYGSKQYPDKERAKKVTEEAGEAFNIIKTGKKPDLSKTEEGEEIIALPSYAASKGKIVLAFYIFSASLLLPIFTFRKWKLSKKKNSIGILYSTTRFLYEKIDDSMISTPFLTIRNLMNLLSETEEISGLPVVFDEKVAEVEEETPFSKVFSEAKKFGVESKKSGTVEKDDFRGDIEVLYGIPMKGEGRISKKYNILLSHIFRLNKYSDEEYDQVQTYVLKLLEVVKRIATARNLEKGLEAAFNLERMVFQAVPDPDFWKMQGMATYEDLLLEKYGEEKIEFKCFCGDLPEISIEKVLLNHEETMSVKRGERCLLEVHLSRGGSGKYQYEDDDVEEMNCRGKFVATPVHSPFMITQRYLYWSLYIVVNGNIKPMLVFGDFEGLKSCFFELDSEENMKIDICVLSGCYFNIDKKVSIKIEVK